jgi:superfamily I DNA/RNA helicase
MAEGALYSISMEELNSRQKQAVTTTDGVVVIKAGPGTGKTKTLVARIEHLVKDLNILPENILALTVTQKAAAEMRDRLKTTLPQVKFPHIYTFHAFAHGILERAGKALILVPEEERQKILSQVAEQYKDMKKRDIGLHITRYKSSITAKKDEMVAFYDSLLAAQGYMDFDDMLLFLFELLETDSIVREQVQTQFTFIHVDEFQDTNMLQYRILQKAAEPENALFVIGDPLQSIYSFRGANPEVFDYLKWDYPDAVEVSLEQNYRSGKNILETSAAFFPDSPSLQPSTKETGEVVLVDTMNEFTEADFIVNTVCSLMGGTDVNYAAQDGNVRFSDFAVIYRTHASAGILEQKFSDSAIPYQIIGSNALYEQKEIKCITAWLLYLLSKNPMFLETARELCVKKISMGEQSALEKTAMLPISKIIREIEDICGLRKQTEDSTYKTRNLNQFAGNLRQFDSHSDSLKKTVEYLLYLKEHEYFDPTGDKVTLMTIHASKGLEFDTVFLCGLEEGIIPLIRNDSETNFEEEKRLLYVALTRAKRRVYMLRARTRNKQKVKISSFESYLKPAFYFVEKDEAIEKIAKKIQKKEEKKSQMSLF